jgi:hypothetical protein
MVAEESDKRKPDAAPAGANSAAIPQNGSAADTPKPVTPASSEQNAIVSNEVPSRKVDAAIALSDGLQSRHLANGAPW